MPRVICEFCRERVPQRQYPLHLKRCIKARRALKKQVGFTKIEEPSELVPQEEIIDPFEPVENTETFEEMTEDISPEEIEPEPVENTGKSKKKKK